MFNLATGAVRLFFPAGAGADVSSSTCAPKVWTTFSKRLNLARSSVSCGFRGFRGARPGPGKTQSIPAFTQLLQGFCLSQRTFLLLHVTQLRGFGSAEEPDVASPFVRLGDPVAPSIVADPSVCCVVALLIGALLDILRTIEMQSMVLAYGKLPETDSHRDVCIM